MSTLVSACSTADDDAAHDGALGTQTSAMRNAGGDPTDPGGDPWPGDTPPKPPKQPIPQGQVARISGDELYTALGSVLASTKLVIDTTGVSPTIPGTPVYLCTYPNQAARAEATAACFQEPANLRAQCFQQIAIDFPNIKQCATQRPPRHSYIDFGTAAEAYGAVDVPFDKLATIERDSWGPGGVKVDINNVHTQISNGTFFANFTRELTGRATADLWLTLYSNSPTLPCVATSVLVGCPDVELSNMKVNVRLTGLGPSAYDDSKLGFDQILATFYFDRNLHGVPDWMVTAFVDIDKVIHDNVERNIERALGTTAGRTALERALTALVLHKVKPDPNVMGGGIKRFYRGWYEGGALMVDYEPEPVLQMQ